MVLALEIWGNRADLYLVCVYRLSRNRVHVLTTQDHEHVNPILTAIALGANESEAVDRFIGEMVIAEEFESGAAAEKFALRLATVRLKSNNLWEPLYEGVACLTKLARDPRNFEEPEDEEPEFIHKRESKTDSSYESDNLDFAARRRALKAAQARRASESEALAALRKEGLCTVQARRGDVNAYSRTLNVAVVGYMESGETVAGQIVRNTPKSLHIRTSIKVVGKEIRWHVPDSDKVIGVTTA